LASYWLLSPAIVSGRGALRTGLSSLHTRGFQE
jgi:hypothetical protein